MKLKEIVPFGRSYREYELMFNLTLIDKSKKILGCGDGPSSFNAEMTELGYNVISIDPIYEFSGTQIKQRFEAVIDNIIDQVNSTPNDWVWTYHKNSENLRFQRIKTIKTFLNDYEKGKQEQRYRIASLPKLPFKNKEFQLALCSHLLFLYSEILSLEFHLQSLKELCRIAIEVRIFPLLTLKGQMSKYLEPIRRELETLGLTTKIETVNYELQKGGNQMLVIINKKRV
jgi:hypothetical protein